MQNPRKHGNAPYLAAVVHGGPGALGDMAPVAKELSSYCGVLEPLQTRDTIEGLLLELRAAVTDNADAPVTLIGHSWGAWLSFMFASVYPLDVKKLILVGSGPFEAVYSNDIMPLRLNRLGDEERKEAIGIIRSMDNARNEPGGEDLSRFGKLMSKADSFEPMTEGDHGVMFRKDLFLAVWGEARSLRDSGELKEYGRNIKCPVVAIHGDYDPHPANGVRGPLTGIVKDFRFILLERCGHAPWNERYARGKFFEMLKKEVMGEK